MDEPGQIGEKMMEGLKNLKTQRLLPIVGQTFLICDTTPMHTEEKLPLIYLPASISHILGLKDKTQLKGIKQIQSNQLVTYLILVGAVLLSGAYPLLIHKLEGNFLQRLYIRYLINLVLLIPIVVIEMQRKATSEMFSWVDALGPRTLLKNYFNSVFLTLWNVCFCIALRHTEISSVLYFSNLMLLIWVFNKIFRRASGISEMEVNGSVICLLGVLIFAVKQWISRYDESNTISLYSDYSAYGVGFAILASLCAALFFVTNYELTYYLPSYTSLCLVTVFTLANLEAINFGLSILRPTAYPFNFLFLSSSLL